jgi:methylated-DNA-protein-cysteine methyltransferase related protein
LEEEKVDSFFQEVYKIVLKIPRGRVTTYSHIAKMLGNPRGARVVGWAMRAIPENLKLPAHRVVKKSGELAPFYVFGSDEIQRALLEREGVTFTEDRKIEMEKHMWYGDE